MVPKKINNMPGKTSGKNGVVVSLKSRLLKEDKACVRQFLDTGDRRLAFRENHKNLNYTDAQIYKWYSRQEVKNYISKIATELDVFDTFLDMKLLDIIRDEKVGPKSKIDAIKLWNEVRKRIDNSTKIQTNIDLSNVTDDALLKIFGNISSEETKGLSEVESLDYDEEDNEDEDNESNDDDFGL